MKGIALYVHALHLLIGNLEPRLVVIGIQYCFYGQPCLGCGMPYKLQDDFISSEGLGSPVDVDEAEHLMLYGIALTRTRRIVTDMDRKPCPVGELLQRVLPEPIVTPVTRTTITEQEDLTGLRVLLLPQSIPPCGQ